MSQKRYTRNIGLSYAFTTLMNLSFTHGIWMIFLASRGFSLLQLGALEAIFHVTSFLMEVPTGSVADIWGRKASRIAGRISFSLSLVLMYFGSSFPVQILSFIFSALGYNLESGAGEALLFDSLLLDRAEERYLQIKGKDELFYQVSNILSFLLGGYLASCNYLFAFGLTILTNILAFTVALFFREPAIERTQRLVLSGYGARILASIAAQIQGSLATVRKSPSIAYLIIFSESLFAFMICLFFYLQNHWTNLGFTPTDIGVVFSLHAALAALVSVNAQRLERLLTQTGILVICPLLLLCTLWGVALSPYSRSFYVFSGVLEGLLAPTISTYLNHLIPSSLRSTILSFQSMVYSLFMILIFPIVGYIGSVASLPFAFTLLAVFASLLTASYLVQLARQKRKRR
ncbi:MAG: MFS transporter [Sphaerochaeta sp.]|uniref:MFS transporter n=1 Tax=Sphaerochaeta sp. TaxID=1972642 RepID=UPI002FC58CB1